jgi:hypothetical protein
MAAGTDLHLPGIGALVFFNQRGKATGAPADLDDAVYAVVREALDGGGLFDITRKPLTGPESQALAAEAARTQFSLFGNQVTATSPAVQALLDNCGCDQLLLITPTTRAELYGTNQTARGMSYVVRGCSSRCWWRHFSTCCWRQAPRRGM